MKDYFPIILFSIFIISVSNAQFSPSAFIDAPGFQDVHIVDEDVYYSTRFGIYKIEDNNEKSIIEERGWSQLCLRGKFFENNDGWAYLGWQFYEIDFSQPILLLRTFADQALQEYTINLTDKVNGRIEAASYQSLDSIYVLSNTFDGYHLNLINADSEIVHSSKIELSNLKELIQMQNDLILIVGQNSLHTFKSGEIIDEFIFGTSIIDINYVSNTHFEILTENNIYWLNHSFSIIRIIPLPNNGRVPVSIFSQENTTYLIEHENFDSYISSIDDSGNILSEFKELPLIHYEHIKIYDDKFAIWGDNLCPHSFNILKLDIEGVDYAIPTVDFGIEELTVNHIGNTTDTVIIDGDLFTFTKSQFAWAMKITNFGSEPIDRYYVNSDNSGFGSPRFISFMEDEVLNSGESRDHSGSFSITNFNGSLLNFFTWVNTNQLDRACTDNSYFTSTITNTQEIEKKNIDLYPNPAFNEIFLSVPNGYDYSIYDVQGVLHQQVRSHTSQNIDISTLPPGLYYIRLKSDNLQTTKKFVKN